MPLSRRFLSAKRRRPCRIRKGVLAGLALLTFIAVPSAHAQNVIMKARPGLGNQYRVGEWMPVAVNLSNQSERVAGEIRVVHPRAEPRFVVTTVKPVDLANASQQQHMVYIRPESPLPEMAVVLSAGRVQKQINVRMNDMRTLQDEDALLMVLGPQDSGLSYLNGLPVHPPASKSKKAPGINPGAQNQASGEVRVAHAARPEDVPDDRRGLASVHTLVLGDFSLDALPPERLQAVRDWILSGGALLVTGGADYRRLQTPALSDLLPVNPSGVRTLASADLPKYETRLNGPVVAADFRLKPGAKLVDRTGGLVAYRPYGLGKVVFVAFDPITASSGAVDGRRMWQGLIQSAVSRKAPSMNPGGYYSHSGAGMGNGQVSQVAMEMPSVGAPSFRFLGGYLLCYLLLLSPANFFFLRRVKRPELAWVTVPAIILLFTFGSYGAGYAMKGGKLMLNEVTHITAGSGAARAKAVTYLGLFSPARHTYRITAEPDSVITPLVVDDKLYGGYPSPLTNFSYTALQGDKPGLAEISVNMWTTRGFEMERMVDLGGSIEGEYRLKPGPNPRVKIAEGRVRNRSRMKMEHCVLRYGDFTSPPFDLNPGESRGIRTPLASGYNVIGAKPPGVSESQWSAYKAVAYNTGGRLTLVGMTSPQSGGVRVDGQNPAGARAAVLSVVLPHTEAKGGAR